MTHHTFTRHTQGFTLVELLIATSIFVVTIISVYAAFQTGVVTYHKIDSAFSVYQTARILLQRLETELTNACMFSKEGSGFRGKADALEFFSVSSVFKNGAFSANVLRLKYELQTNALRRSVATGGEIIKEGGETIETLSDDIKEISFWYASHSNAPEEAYDWQQIWPKPNDAGQLKSLPLAVKIRLTVIERNRGQRTPQSVEFTKTVAIPLSLHTGT